MNPTDLSTLDWRLQILGALASLVLAILASVTPLLVRAAVRYVEARLHIDISRADEEALGRSALQAVAWVEEQARKNRRYGVALTQRQKLAQASEYVRTLMRRRAGASGDVSKLTSDDALRMAVEAALHMYRASGSAPSAHPGSTPPTDDDDVGHDLPETEAAPPL